MRKLFIATPTHSGDLCHEYVYGLLANIYALNDAGVGTHVEFLPGNCYVALARNQLVARFMASDCTDMLFVDADLGFEPRAMLKVMQAPVPFVCGLYPYKVQPESYPARWLTEPDGRVRIVNGLVEVEGAPTGFMRLKREVIEKMQAAYPERLFKDDQGHVHYDLFACELVNGQWWGEDFRFCQLWRALGEQIWVVPDIAFQHVGRKAFGGNWHRFMINEAGPVQEVA